MTTCRQPKHLVSRATSQSVLKLATPPPGGKVPALPHTFPQASEFGAAMADLAETGSRGVNSSFTLLWTARRTGKEMSGHSGAPPGPEVLQC